MGSKHLSARCRRFAAMIPIQFCNYGCLPRYAFLTFAHMAKRHDHHWFVMVVHMVGFPVFGHIRSG
jgi:hypothetical protein